MFNPTCLRRRILSAVILFCMAIPLCSANGADNRAEDLRRAGHVLNRLAYGPTPSELARVRQIGAGAYIEEQLNPEAINERTNVRLRERENDLFEVKLPLGQTPLVMAGEFWMYRKGTSEPKAGWNQIRFDDSQWLRGRTGIGMGDDDDRTVLSDMRHIEDDPETAEDESQPGYLSVYLRKKFMLDDESLAAINDLVFRVDYDDGFKAYLNGTEVVRSRLPAGDVPYDRRATGSHEAGTPEDFDITGQKNLLRVGENVLAIQVHNQSLTNGDLSMIPELVNVTILPGPTRRVIRGISELQQLVHVRGVYSRKQLQAVLAEFWENHFTTDYDKLADYFDGLQNSDDADAMSRSQALAEAADAECTEYEFFYDNGLGNFGDLLLYSATSPSMLVYLDSVLNVKGAANENYAREILELFAFGVDNRYTQQDIEQLARCFTGWGVCKVPLEQVQDFPGSALEAPVACEVQYADDVLLDLGTGWKYFKGLSEPAAAADGRPTTGWTTAEFDDSAWHRGATGIGYGDGDDTTVLDDMRGGYFSIYLRRRFTLAEPEKLDNPVLEIAYDDGYVVYLNGDEIARSANMVNRGTPPAHDQSAIRSHEVTSGTEYISLKPLRSILRVGENILAIQVHNSTLNSSDLSIRPRLLDRHILPGSIEKGDRNGVWTFSYDPEQHDDDAKAIFSGTPYEILIPGGRQSVRSPAGGVQDALDVIRAMPAHPSTAEFICIKLIQKFVSDEITLATYKDGTAPAELVELLADAIAAWNSTDPPGNIATVMRAILDPVNQSNAFWQPIAYRSKVKTPVEFINSSLRVLNALAEGAVLPRLNDDMGMHLFTRDDPDGYSELGFDWIDTASMLSRIEFVRALAQNRNSNYYWDSLLFFDDRGLETAQQIVDYFDELLYQNTLPEANRRLLLEYLSTGTDGFPDRLSRMQPSEFQQRIEDFMALMLSMPQWNYQ